MAVLTVGGGLFGPGGAVAAPQPTVAQVRRQVGIYLGSGLILHAPQTGDVVKITPLRYIGGFTTVVRL